MKPESKTLLWGTAVAIVLVVAQRLLATKFPNLTLQIEFQPLKFYFLTAMLLTGLLLAYRRLFSRIGYWLLLCAFIVLHVGVYVLYFSDLIKHVAPIEGDMLYGLLVGIEFVGFALVIATVYRTGPNIKWL